MKIGSVHLTYCLNIHPGETWDDVCTAVESKSSRVKALLSWKGPFGLGLRIGAAAADQAAAPGALQKLQGILARHGMYVFTVNGFPYGRFHGTAVKEEVYAPDWRDPRRLSYTCRLADILGSLCPKDAGGSISTVPASYAAWISSDADREAVVRNLADCAAHVGSLGERVDRDLHVGLEPEPGCLLETSDQVLSFWENWLLPLGVAHLVSKGTCGAATAERWIRACLGVCVDTCHLALQFEDPADALWRLHRHGVRVSKVQISAAVRVPNPHAAMHALSELDDSVYLHQVRRRAPGDVVRAHADLPEAIADAGKNGFADREEWRVHCHVPLYFQGDGPLQSTATDLGADFWRALCQGPGPTHAEIETYTFSVLPEAWRGPSVEQSLACEYRWVLDACASSRS